MQTSTFDNLSEIKKKAFLERAFAEFNHQPYQQASINAIIKDLGIARGSVYRYFKDKKALWLYLKSTAEQAKVGLLQNIQRNNYPDFWAYFQELYVRGISFENTFPAEGKFLYWIYFKESDLSLKAELPDWQTQALFMFRHWIEQEQSHGSLDKNLPLEASAQLMLAVHIRIADLSRPLMELPVDHPERKKKFADLEVTIKQLLDLLKSAL